MKKFDRIKWLRCKLVETGHEASQRIKWESELKALIATPSTAEPVIVQVKPKCNEPPKVVTTSSEIKKAAIREFVPPSRKSYTHVWNYKTLSGWPTSGEVKFDRERNRAFPYLPQGYINVSGFIIPPWLRPAVGMWMNGIEAYGVRSFYENKSGKHGWQSKSGKLARQTHPDIAKQFHRELYEFLMKCPCIRYYEAEARFSHKELIGQGIKEVRAKKHAEEVAKEAARKKLLKQETERSQIAKQKRREDSALHRLAFEKRLIEQRANAERAEHQRVVAELNLLLSMNDQQRAEFHERRRAEAAFVAEERRRAEEEATKPPEKLLVPFDEWLREQRAIDAQMRAEWEESQKPKAEPVVKPLTAAQRMARAHRRIKAAKK
ncbi:MAG: hypothetical protein CMA72_09835 [Euryarchaeota archaeon]|nr:hypothetical protein [Euryarchaeota archaeon]